MPSGPEVQYVAELIRAIGVWFALVIVLLVVVVAGGWQMLTAFITRRVTAAAQEAVDKRVRDHQALLTKDLESHRVQLELSADAARLTFQRQLQEFTLYATKRYDVYTELFKLMLHAEGALAAFYGLRSESGFQYESRAEIETLLAEQAIPGELRTEVLQLFDTGDRTRFAKRLRDILRDIERGEAVRKYWEARNYFLEHELFLSDAAVPVMKKAFDAMHNMVGYVRFPEPGAGLDGQSIKSHMSEAIDQARKVMRLDLQRSDFDPRITRADDSDVAASPA